MSTVLIVDDSPFDRQLASQVLMQNEELEVEVADGGVAALDRIERGGIDLVVTDLQMPMINGIQLVMNIREDFPEIPVILMTGEGSELIAMEALTHGAVNYVPKRMMNEWLQRTVLEALESQNAERTHHALMDVASYVEFRLKISSRTLVSAVEKVDEIAAGVWDGSPSEVVRLGIAVKQALEQALKGKESFDFEFVIEPSRCRFTLRSSTEGQPIFDPDELPEMGNQDSFESPQTRGFFLMRSHLDEVLIDPSGQEAVLIAYGATENQPAES